MKNLEGTVGMANFALAFGERRFPPPPERFCGHCAIGRETRRQVAETAKAKKISRKILRIQKEFLTLQRFSPLLKKEPRKEYIERFTIDKSSTRAFVRAAGRKAAQARTKILCQFYQRNNIQTTSSVSDRASEGAASNEGPEDTTAS